MHNSLILQPIHNSSAIILKAFIDGKPLSPEQQHFLESHQKSLSNAWHDPLLRYYLKPKNHEKREIHETFLLPQQTMNNESIHNLKNRIQGSLDKNFSHVIFNITPQQFTDFQKYTIQELIYWHGNQFLTGMPFYPGGISHVIYYQWGNLFGVAYPVLTSGKTLIANILLYFEDMQDRDLEKCVADYNQQVEKNIQLQNKIIHEKNLGPILQPQNSKIVEEKLTPFHYFLVDHFNH